MYKLGISNRGRKREREEVLGFFCQRKGDREKSAKGSEQEGVTDVWFTGKLVRGK